MSKRSVWMVDSTKCRGRRYWRPYYIIDVSLPETNSNKHHEYNWSADQRAVRDIAEYLNERDRERGLI